MLNQNDKIELFSEEINKNADKIVKKLEKQTERFRRQQLDAFESDAREQLEHRIDYASHRLKTEMNREISALRAEQKRAALAHRAEIVDAAFDEAKGRLQAFRATPAYRDLLSDVLRSLAAGFDGDVILYVAPQEVPLAAELSQSLTNVADIRADASITLGLAKASDPAGAVFADDTMECRLAQYRETFLERSGLIV
ncbi:MAG: V-type ATP synthase subunit E [Clostridia bacterium]|nr:V-type ATP synthase subunit E [Clostridia bacterium]